MHHSNHFITTTAFDDYYFYAVRIIVFSQNEAAPRLDDETCDMGILFPILMTFIEADKNNIRPRRGQRPKGLFYATCVKEIA